MRRVCLIIVFILSATSFSSAETFEIDVNKDRPIRIHGLAIYDGSTCQYVRVRTRIRKEPQHGTVEAVQIPSDFGENNRCEGKTARRAGILYTPEPGFVGKDEVVVVYWYSRDWGGDKSFRYVYELNVR